jgi:hypothetical protein
MRAALILPCALATLACARAAPAGGGSASTTLPADSLRGTIEVVGSEPATLIALLMDGGRRAVTLQGERPLLDRLSTLEVTVWGELVRPGVFRVDRFAVRAADGIAAIDGVLAQERGGWALVTADGRHHPISRLPQTLAGMAGARVWIAGPIDRPNTFGIIRQP